MKARIISSIFVFIIILSTRAFAADIEVTVYADDSYIPYSYEEEGKVKGIYTEILKVAFSRMKGYKVKIQPIPWKRGLRMLENGTAFALYPPIFMF